MSLSDPCQIELIFHQSLCHSQISNVLLSITKFSIIPELVQINDETSLPDLKTKCHGNRKNGSTTASTQYYPPLKISDEYLIPYLPLLTSTRLRFNRNTYIYMKCHYKAIKKTFSFFGVNDPSND